MASAPEPPQNALDPTFRRYSHKQATDYAEGRLVPSKALIDLILDHHRSTGGHNGILLDVGCGPGNATRGLALYFDAAYGADAGESMVNAAKELGGVTMSGAPIIYELSSAEDLDKMNGVAYGSVDMITAATAAHWFEMPKFWAAAANLLKPGGTVAIWTVFNKPAETRTDQTKLQTIFDNFRNVVLAPYSTPSSRLTQTGYVDLVMPWDDPSTTPLFDRETFSRHELDGKDYLPVGSKAKKTPDQAGQKPPNLLTALERMVRTIGSVTRWQEAHPDLVGTEDDCVEVLMRQIREELRNGDGKIDVSGLAARMTVALLLVKRK
ncbi:hypothetical protein NM208_g3138 [Fusarium decemcellulare]|uniref:Uncharacterized protein n=1 Tax=Fusarium decemcellulare TaxID=57161 RepID=A0ACC1SQA0_9HYPO|nr:hypothetical protein NM208_g3138 [Fusarium decemcellulare]